MSWRTDGWMNGAVLMTAVGMVAAGMTAGCAQVEYLGNGTKGFWSDSPAKISPNDAYRMAQPHVEATWEARCEEVHHHDTWCDKLPVDHMVRRGKYYYVTRTSYPYKSYDPLTQYAVRVHVETGEVIPLK